MNSMSSSEQAQGQVAPFVAKTYEMVSNPRTDGLIRWGRGNNSFLVLDPVDFSQVLLPCYFKHSNFSSFVRQLNTYGFKKVDPDSWEFAHESFLRGQKHFLPLIMRRKKKYEGDAKKSSDALEEDEEMLLQELGRLRKEQKALDEELQGMNRRLQATERRPHQMMSFLAKVAEDPDLIPRLISSKKEQQLQQLRQQELIAGDKKRRVFASSSSVSSSSSSSPPPHLVLASHSNRAGPPFELNPLIGASAGFPVEPETPSVAFTSDGGVSGYRSGVACVPAMAHVGLGGGGDVAAFEKQMLLEPELEVAETSPVDFPFSLLGHGFI